MIIAIDFDGTIVADNYPQIGVTQPYAADVIRSLHDAGHFIIIWTSRSGSHLMDAVNHLLEHGIPFDRVNAGNPHNERQYGSETRKVYADMYIDDHNLGGFPGWLSVRDTIINGQ